MSATENAGGKRVLYVEDDPIVAATVVEILSDVGYCVDSVAEGRVALATVLHRCPDLLLLDLGLPDLDGLEVCRIVRRHCPDLPILALTGRTETADLLAGFAAGVDDYIRKPFDIAVLLARIAAVLRAVDQQRRDYGQPA